MTATTVEATRNITAPVATTPKRRSQTSADRRKRANVATSERPAPFDAEASALEKKGRVVAERFLMRRGYDILESGWTCFAGTADIIALDDDALVFVDVVTAAGEEGFPKEGVNEEQRQQWEKIALAFLGEYELCDKPVRFDVVSIVVIGKDRALIRHQTNALSAA